MGSRGPPTASATAALLVLLVVVELTSAFVVLRPPTMPTLRAPRPRVRKAVAAAPRRAGGLGMMAAAVDPQRLPDLSQVRTN